MKDLFMCLLLNLQNHGEIVDANMYKGGKFSAITIETKCGTYSVGIHKEDEKENENGN